MIRTILVQLVFWVWYQSHNVIGEIVIPLRYELIGLDQTWAKGTDLLALHHVVHENGVLLTQICTAVLRTLHSCVHVVQTMLKSSKSRFQRIRHWFGGWTTWRSGGYFGR